MAEITFQRGDRRGISEDRRRGLAFSQIAAIGSGGNYALAAARAIDAYESDAETIARKAMQVAADICVFTNDRVTVETV